MLNAIVEVELSQVECVALLFLQHSHSKVGHKLAEGRRSIEGGIDLACKFIEFNVFTVVWEDACQKHKKKKNRR